MHKNYHPGQPIRRQKCLPRRGGLAEVTSTEVRAPVFCFGFRLILNCAEAEVLRLASYVSTAQLASYVCFAVVGFEPTKFQVFPKEVCWLVHWAIQWMTSLKNRPRLIRPKFGIFQIVNGPAQTPNLHEDHFWNRGPFWTKKPKTTQVLPSPPFPGLFKQKKMWCRPAGRPAVWTVDRPSRKRKNLKVTIEYWPGRFVLNLTPSHLVCW